MSSAGVADLSCSSLAIHAPMKRSSYSAPLPHSGSIRRMKSGRSPLRVGGISPSKVSISAVDRMDMSAEAERPVVLTPRRACSLSRMNSDMKARRIVGMKIALAVRPSLKGLWPTVMLSHVTP